MTTGPENPDALLQDLILMMQHQRSMLDQLLALLEKQDEAAGSQIADLKVTMEWIAAGIEGLAGHMEMFSTRLQTQEAALTGLTSQMNILVRSFDREARARTTLEAKIDALTALLSE